MTLITPTVSWYQRRDHLHVVIEVEQPEDIEYSLSKEHNELTIRRDTINGFSIELPFFAPVLSVNRIDGRFLTLKVEKKDKNSAYWPSLVKDQSKKHWLKVDWQHWQEEEEEP